MSEVDYRYELRRGEEVIATGHVRWPCLLEIGDRVQVVGREGIVRVVQPLLGETEVRLVIQLLAGSD